MIGSFQQSPKDWKKRQRKILAGKKQAADEKFQKIAAQALERVKARSSAPYDGVLGTPPNWVRRCGSILQEYERRRAWLLEGLGYSPAEIREFMQANREIYKPGVKSIKPIPPKIMDSIDFLCRLQKAISLGGKKGLIMLVGEDAEYGRRRAKTDKKAGKFAWIRYKKARQHSIACAEKEWWPNGVQLRPGQPGPKRRELADRIHAELNTVMPGGEAPKKVETVQGYIEHLVPAHLKNKRGRPKKHNSH